MLSFSFIHSLLLSYIPILFISLQCQLQYILSFLYTSRSVCAYIDCSWLAKPIGSATWITRIKSRATSFFLSHCTNDVKIVHSGSKTELLEALDYHCIASSATINIVYSFLKWGQIFTSLSIPHQNCTSSLNKKHYMMLNFVFQMCVSSGILIG